MVAPVLSFTGSPTWNPPVVALAFAPAVAAESAEGDEAEGDELEGAWSEVRGLEVLSPDAGGDEPIELLDELMGAANAAPALAIIRPAAARRRKVERMGVSLSTAPGQARNSSKPTSFHRAARERRK